MTDAIERIFENYERGRIGRREALRCLAGLVAVLSSSSRPARAEEPSSPTFRARGIDHIALSVPDLSLSRDFYRRHLGLEVLSESESSCFLSCGPEDFLALFRGEPPGLHHYCYRIDDYRPEAAMERLRRAGLGPRRHADRVYFDDPDGLTVQVASGGKNDPD